MSKPLVIIPAFNEGKVIFDVVTSLQEALSADKIDANLVVINDCSTDNTKSEAERAGAQVVSHLINQGAGGAIATGLRYAQKLDASLAVTCDGDGQHLPADVIAGIQLMSQASTSLSPVVPVKAGISAPPDLLLGSRLIDPDGMPPEKRLGNRGLTSITNLFFRTKVTDSQSGLRVFSQAAIKRLFWKDDGYTYCSEMLYRARKLGLSIKEFPIKALYTDYSKTRGQNNWNAIAIVFGILRIRFLELIL